MDEQIEELLPFYALGVLSEAEQTQVETFIATNTLAQVELNQARRAVAALAYGARPIEPAPVVKQRLFERVNATMALPRRQPAKPAPAAPSTWSRLVELFRGPGTLLALAGLSLLVAVVAGAWAYGLNGQLGQVQQLNAQLEHRLGQQDEALAALQEQIKPLQTEQRQNSVLQGQLAAQAQQLATQNEQLTSLNKLITPLQEDNDSLRRELAAQADKLVALQQVQENQTTSKTVAALEQELAAQREIVASLMNQVTQLQAFNANLGRELSTQRAIMAEVTAPDVQAMTIAGTESWPQAHGQLIANPGAAEAVVIVSGLPPLQPGYIYQFWLVQSSQLIRAGVLNVDEAGLGVLQLSTHDTPIGSFDAMGVSIEPKDDSTGPAHDMIMLGSFSS
jgi:anti-sigma factor RsiW